MTCKLNFIPSDSFVSSDFRPSILLNEKVNSQFIQSVYRYGLPTIPKLPLLYGRQLNYTYNEPLHPCTINSFTSTYFQQVVGSISSFQNSSILCAFTLQRSANVTSTVQIDVNL